MPRIMSLRHDILHSQNQTKRDKKKPETLFCSQSVAVLLELQQQADTSF